MSMMICARTHASIAAYSSCVPTYVFGYSVKSKGIARDIYGTYEGHVMPVQELSSPQVLTESIETFIKQSEREREYLRSFIPEYTARACAMSDALQI
jgi:polysaccharide pyruvyl transferase WcaK-like protein